MLYNNLFNDNVTNVQHVLPFYTTLKAFENWESNLNLLKKYFENNNLIK